MKAAYAAGALALALVASTAGRADPSSPLVALFAQNAGVSNTFEIAESKIVLETSTDPAVRAFAWQMVHDHAQAQRDLDYAGGFTGVATRIELDRDRKKLVDDLGLMDSPKLDRTYLADQVEAHASAVAALAGYAVNGRDPALRAYARITLPVVRHHQMMLESLTGSPAPL